MKLKHRLRDAYIYFLDSSGAIKRYQARQAAHGPLVRVIAFHDVPDATWFGEMIDMLTTSYHVITPTEFATQQFSSDQINVLITFDDGYQSWIDVALPTLAAKEVSVVFFVATGILDAVEKGSDAVASFMTERLQISPKEPLTTAGVEQLVAAGHTVGAHTVTHPSLAQLPATEITKELTVSKTKLEGISRNEVTWFAYPFGTRHDYSDDTTALAHNLGFRFVCSAVSGWWHASAPTIPRTLVEKQQSVQSLKRWIVGGYDIFARIK